MTNGIEAMGDVATGAAWARAVEPHAGEAGSQHEHAHGHEDCRNCGTVLIGPHCHACGQAGHVHRTMGAIGHDILHGVFHFEGKIWSTLPMLAFRPGELTRRYIDGERVRFVSPMAMFLFSVFLMFAVVANLPGWTFANSDLLKTDVSGGVAQAREKLGEERAKAVAAVGEAEASLAKERSDEAPDADRIRRLERRLKEARDAVSGLDAARRILPDTGHAGADTVAPTPGENWFEAKWNHARENPKLVLYKVKTSAYKYSWALIPISLPFIWLLFPFRRDVNMYDHAIFATYSLTFMSLLTIVLALLGAIGVNEGLLWTAAMLIPPVHIYKQLKGGYRLSRGGALWRTFLMLNFALVTTTLFVTLLLYLGLAD
jgi:hypothetical protein